MSTLLRSVRSAAVVMTSVATLLVVPAVTTAAHGASALDQPISRTEVLARAQNWTDRNIQYSQTATATGPGGAHSWRTDCSGFVSMAWLISPTGLSAPSTRTLPDAKYTHTIGGKANLKPGDILNWYDHHTVLFEKWANSAHTSIWLYEESNPTDDMNHRTAALSDYASYTALRYDNITG
jgi:hypothetical protein